MAVDILIEDPRWSDTALAPVAKRALRAVATHLDLPPLDLAILACDDVRIAGLNADFRDKAVPTNVLSWPSDDRAPKTPGTRPVAPDDPEIGDIAISFDTCDREARAQGKSFDHHVTHLVVHGILHLLGYDHIRDADGDLMEATETAILGKLGVADPYGNETR